MEGENPCLFSLQKGKKNRRWESRRIPKWFYECSKISSRHQSKYINLKTSFFNEKMSFKRIQEFQVICRKCYFLLQFGFDYKDKIKYVKDDKRKDKKSTFLGNGFWIFQNFRKTNQNFGIQRRKYRAFSKFRIRINFSQGMNWTIPVRNRL